MEPTGTCSASPQTKAFGVPIDYPTTFPMISTSVSIYLSIYWCLLGRPNHCFSFFHDLLSCRPRKTKSLPKSPKIHPKSIQKSTKIFPKPSQNPPRTLPNSIKNSKRAPKALRTRFFQFFIDFWMSLGLPKLTKFRCQNTFENEIEKNKYLMRSVLKGEFKRVLGGFWEGSGTVLVGFGWILEVF